MKLIFFLILGGILPGLAQISVSGLTTRQSYQDDVTFTVSSETGFTITATLDEAPISLDTPTTESRPGYHELHATKTPDGGGSAEELTVQFIIRDSNRPSSDNGIATWTPKPAVSAPASALDTTFVTFVTPSTVTAGMTFPFMVRLENQAGEIARLNASPLISNSTGEATSFKILRGAGAGSWTAPTDGPFTLTLHLGNRTFQKEMSISTSASQTLAGELTESLTVAADSLVEITDDLLVPQGMTLRFEQGCLVRISPGVVIEVLGTLETAGSPANPLVFHRANPDLPWGGFYLRGGSASADLDGAFFTGAGSVSNWAPNNGFSTHRDEQPVITFDAGTSGGTCVGELTNVWIVDNPSAQASHGRNAELTFERCLVQRTTSVGQFNGGTFDFFDSHAVEFPFESPNFSDEDNDALYLTAGAHHIRGSVIGWTKDDGIDCGGSQEGTLLVEDSWIDSCFHEGFALSGDKLVTITNTVSINNGQGLEVGYSGSMDRPDATATNMLITGNAHGARYGDNYDWNYRGKLDVSSSFLLQNGKDVFGFEWDSWTYREEDMTIENNVLTSPLVRHPTNAVLDPGIHAAQIANFLDAADGPRGFAIVERSSQNPRADYGGDISLHLDRPASGLVTIPWQLLSDSTIIASGALEFPPGEVSQILSLPPLADPHQSADWIVIQFHHSPTATATGPRTCHFLDLPGGATPPSTILIPFGSTWAYLSDGSDQEQAWRAPGFDDSLWPTGLGQLGYGDDDEATNVGHTGTDDTKNATTYFRHQFTSADPEQFASLEVDLLFDDGAVIYLNGHRVADANMPDDDPAFDFYIGTTSTDNERETFSIPASHLSPGLNTIAVEIHQEGPTSSDISFDLEMTGIPAPEAGIRAQVSSFHNERYLFWTTDGVMPQSGSNLNFWLNRPDLTSPIRTTPEPISPPSQFFRLMKSE